MSREDFIEGLLKEFPLLKKDRIALIVAKDFVLSGAMVMGKQNTEEAFLQDHPVSAYFTNDCKNRKYTNITSSLIITLLCNL